MSAASADTSSFSRSFKKIKILIRLLPYICTHNTSVFILFSSVHAIRLVALTISVTRIPAPAAVTRVLLGGAVISVLTATTTSPSVPRVAVISAVLTRGRARMDCVGATRPVNVSARWVRFMSVQGEQGFCLCKVSRVFVCARWAGFLSVQGEQGFCLCKVSRVFVCARWAGFLSVQGERVFFWSSKLFVHVFWFSGICVEICNLEIDKLFLTLQQSSAMMWTIPWKSYYSWYVSSMFTCYSFRVPRTGKNRENRENG